MSVNYSATSHVIRTLAFSFSVCHFEEKSESESLLHYSCLESCGDKNTKTEFLLTPPCCFCCLPRLASAASYLQQTDSGNGGKLFFSSFLCGLQLSGGGVAVCGGSLTEEIRLRTRMRGTLSWAPPRFQIIFTLQPTHRSDTRHVTQTRQEPTRTKQTRSGSC